MPTPAKRIVDMPRSGIRRIMDLAAGRPDIVHLEVGQPDFATPDHVVEAAIDAARSGQHGYTPNKGLPELREAVTTKLAADNQVHVDVDEVVVGCGAVNVLMESLMALVEPGDAVLVPDPGWPNYEMMADILAVQAVHYPLDATEGYEPDLERLDALLSQHPRARVILLNSPNNPTGAVYRPETIGGIVELAQRHDVYIVSDECYEQIVFDGADHVSPAALDDTGRVVTIQSVSKAFAMTGWRIGWAAADRPLADLIAKVQEPVVACASGVSQMAARAALTGDQGCVHDMVAQYQQRRDVAVDLVDRAGLARSQPRGAFYLLLDARDLAHGHTDDVAERPVRDHGVAVAPGDTFGPRGAGHVRISLATAEDQIRQGLTRIVDAITATA